MKRSVWMAALGLFGLVAASWPVEACSAPAVGSQCSGSCPDKTVCEQVCACGDPSCPAYQCVTISSTGSYTLDDGGTAKSCNAL